MGYPNVIHTQQLIVLQQNVTSLMRSLYICNTIYCSCVVSLIYTHAIIMIHVQFTSKTLCNNNRLNYYFAGTMTVSVLLIAIVIIGMCLALVLNSFTPISMTCKFLK